GMPDIGANHPCWSPWRRERLVIKVRELIMILELHRRPFGVGDCPAARYRSQDCSCLHRHRARTASLQAAAIATGDHRSLQTLSQRALEGLSGAEGGPAVARTARARL